MSEELVRPAKRLLSDHWIRWMANEVLHPYRVALVGRASGVVLATLMAILSPVCTDAHAQGRPDLDGDVPKHFERPTAQNDYIKRVEMIPMRDGIKLYTVIWIPKGARDAPIIFSRTPYNAAKKMRGSGPTLLNALQRESEEFVGAGYIRVFQDVRGKYGSEGDYEMTRPARGPLNSSSTDESTDAYDAIDWLVKHTPESNGKVGMIGSSYEGFTVAMALLEPHPALKAVVAESPMIDGWMGDDWFHYGAFRQTNFDYIASQSGQRGAGETVPRGANDDYETFLAAGSAGDYAKAHGLDAFGWWRKIAAHPDYDNFWSGQALDKLLAAKPSNVPTLWEQGLWDQEDMWGANHSFAALKAAGHEANNWLVIGPWFHSQASTEGSALGPFKWQGDTAQQFRHNIVLPFFAQYLKDGPPAPLARVTIYDPAANRWEEFNDWPSACAIGCAHQLKPLYLKSNFRLSLEKPAGAESGDSYISDPAKPIPHLPRPVHFSDREVWNTWLLRDQRFIDGRTDMLTYETEVLAQPVKIEGAPVADIFAATTGTDGDFVVRLIDVYPPEDADQPELGGYELPVSSDIFRGRYRNGFEHSTAIPANQPQRYRFELPNQNYIFKPGHRIMVQIQSTQFPLYDRNPQTFVANPLFAKPSDYRKATITVLHSSTQASAVWLPIAP